MARVLAPWRRLGWAVIVVFFGGSVVWASSANRHGAAIGSGVVVTEAKRQTIQHLEGGIVDEILVTEGERVEAGQPLIRFNHTHPKAAWGLLHDRLLAALASQARLIAKRDGAREIAFPDELLKHADEPKVAKIITAAKQKRSGKTDPNRLTERLRKVEAEIADLRDKLRAAGDVLERTEVVAPLPGTVVDLRVRTIGGLLRPGRDLLDLVPELERVIIDMRVDPKDIDVVHADMPAQVRLTAFNARTTPILDGTLLSVSAERITDPATGDPYFAARVILEADDTPFDLARLQPGMQAEVFLVTTERTALDHLIEPVVRSFARAGREP